MRVDQARRLFKELTSEYFAAANVVFANQSRSPMQKLALVLLTPGNVQRPQSPNYEVIDGEYVGNYLSRFSITVDLFTNGAPVVDEETGQTVAYEDNALEDMLSFADFLNSEYVVDWCHRNDVAILVDGDVLDLTARVNDTSYQYRSRLTVQFYFTQRAIGRAGVLLEKSVQYPAGTDPDSGDPVYTETPPVETESQTGDWPKNDDPVLRPQFAATESGGGTEELASEKTGYFTEAEVKEEKVDE